MDCYVKNIVNLTSFKPEFASLDFQFGLVITFLSSSILFA